MSDLYISLALDPVAESCEITGFGISLEACKDHHERTEAPYNHTFLLDDQTASTMSEWFRQCGLPSSHADELRKIVGQTIASEILEELEAKHE